MLDIEGWKALGKKNGMLKKNWMLNVLDVEGWKALGEVVTYFDSFEVANEDELRIV